jgi:hypothetical protein
MTVDDAFFDSSEQVGLVSFTSFVDVYLVLAVKSRAILLHNETDHVRVTVVDFNLGHAARKRNE